MMKEVISASRRTDIPAFYYDWLVKCLGEKRIDCINNFNQQPYSIDLSPENVHSIVLWSKDYNRIVKNPAPLEPYNLFFHFTINDYGKILETNVPAVAEQLIQIDALAKRYNPKQIQWRFDPLIFFEDEPKFGEERLSKFRYLAERIGQIGIERCTLSLFSPYYYAVKAIESKGLRIVKAPEQKLEFPDFLNTLTDIAKENNITLFSCATPILEKNTNIKHGHCIDGDILSSLFGEKATKSKDRSQREACGCIRSKDIGTYTQKCYHNCLYCYSQQTHL